MPTHHSPLTTHYSPLTTHSLKIKVCGTRELANIEAIEALGVDMIGFIFYEKSPRYVAVSPFEADFFSRKKIYVGVFVNEKIETIVDKVQSYPLFGVQLHGKEDVQYIADLKKVLPPDIQIFKAIGIDENFDFDTLKIFEGHCDLFVFDTQTPLHGGSGLKFDWRILDKYQGNIPFLLSGGISVEDAETIQSLRIPQLYGVDLNSKFEISPALKDLEKLKTFMTQAAF